MNVATITYFRYWMKVNNYQAGYLKITVASQKVLQVTIIKDNLPLHPV